MDTGDTDQLETGGTDTGSETLAGTADEDKTFSQQDVDKLITERLARERRKFDKTLQEKMDEANRARLTDSERAIEDAKAEAKSEVKREYATELVAAQIRAELAGLVEDPDTVIEDLNLSRFLDDDMSVDKEAISKLKSKYKSLLDGRKRKSASTFQPGRTSNHKTGSAADDWANFHDSLN